MLNKILRVFVVAVGFMIGPGVVLLVQSIYEYLTNSNLDTLLEPWVYFSIYLVSGIISGIIFLLLSKRISQAIVKAIEKIEAVLSEAPSIVLLSGSIGLIAGLVIAALISVIIGFIPVAWVAVPLTIIDYIIFGYLGLSSGIKRRGDLITYFSNRRAGKRDKESSERAFPKILDTSSIIDGRILDICKTGIIEGEIVIPEFVLSELQSIADSAESIKRAKGRRGLDIIKKMQNELPLSVHISDIDYGDITGVDAKLLKLAKDMGGKIFTNDYNLNKVAAVQDVPVFNINELQNAIKPMLTAGEEISVTIIKDGKEANQGIAYLDDGTMIVVEGAKNKANQLLKVAVTSILQTAAGRMIFAKVK